jgi:hypothetical protein
MTTLERAKCVIKITPTDNLLDMWEMTTGKRDPNIPMVRGWLMDEFEKRFPRAFEAWLNEDAPEDKDLRKYVKEVRA